MAARRWTFNPEDEQNCLLPPQRQENAVSNRSYLYSTNFIPKTDVPLEHRKSAGIGEFAYEIPLAYKILLSVNARPCRSAIAETPEEIAIVGDYAGGVERLLGFLDRIRHPNIDGFRNEAREVLTSPASQNCYFLLEPFEIYAMISESLEEENRNLLREIKNVDAEMESALHNLRHPRPEVETPLPLKQVGFWRRLFGPAPRQPKLSPRPASPDQPLYDLGLGSWENVLFYQLDAGEDQEDEG